MRSSAGRRCDADATGEHLAFEKARGGGTASIVSSGDVLGSIEWRGYDGADYVIGASIRAVVAASPGSGDMPTRLVFSTCANGSSSEVERARLTETGILLVGKAVSDVGVAGIALMTGAAGASTFTSDAATTANFNRKTSDGTIVALSQDGTVEGAISVSGTTVTYGSFCGGHWSQFADNSMPEMRQGTIMDTIDEMSAWPGEDNEQLARVKISDVAGSAAVYGVFMDWSPNDDGTNPTGDMIVAALGAFKVRIAAGLTVARGDLIESNGDGCGRVQADGVMRSSTVAKVTANVVIETYPDGSYTVPATLHCG